MYIISALTSQLRTSSRKIAIKYVGLLVIYKIIDPHYYLLGTSDSKILRAVFEHERLKQPQSELMSEICKIYHN